MRVVHKNVLLAESDDTIVIEGNHYYPPDSIKWDYFQKSNKHTNCPWKGEASYYHIVIDGDEEADAAWYYPEPKDAAKKIKDYVAFYKGTQES